MLEIKQKRRYIAKTKELALDEIRLECGEDYVILNEGEVTEGGLFGFFGTRKFEITIGLIPELKKPPELVPTVNKAPANKTAVIRRPQNNDLNVPVANFLTDLEQKTDILQLTRRPEEKEQTNQASIEELLYSLLHKKDMRDTLPPSSSLSPDNQTAPVHVPKHWQEVLGNTQRGLYQNPNRLQKYTVSAAPKSSVPSHQQMPDLPTLNQQTPDLSILQQQMHKVLNELSVVRSVLQIKDGMTVKDGMMVIKSENSTAAVSPAVSVYDKFSNFLRSLCFADAVVESHLEVLRKNPTAEVPSIEQLRTQFRQNFLQTVSDKFNSGFGLPLKESSGEQKAEKAEKKARVLVFVGPTGAGKTTTVAKCACILASEGKKVALVAADTFKMGAVDHLKFYAKSMSMDFEVVYELEKLSEQIQKFSTADYILVDTVGRGPFSKGQLARMQQSLLEELEAEVYLVISAISKYQDMEKIILGYSGFAADYLLFTKLDETCIYGPLLSIMQKWRRSISFVTYGQTVPGDICLCSEKIISSLLLHDADTPLNLSEP